MITKVMIVFMIGFFIGSILEYFAYEIPKEETKPFIKDIKDCKKYVKAIISKKTIIAFMMGIIYAILYSKYKLNINFFRYASILSILLVVSIIDFKTQDIYLKTTLPAFIISVVFVVIDFTTGNAAFAKSCLLAGLGAALFFAFLAFIHALGWGDVELITICGLNLGLLKTGILILISMLICIIYGLTRMTYSKFREKKKLKLSTYTVDYGMSIFISMLLVTLLNFEFLNFLKI